MSEACKWKHATEFKTASEIFGGTSPNYIVFNHWETSCQRKAQLLLNMTKCPYCGKQIEEVGDD